MKKIIMPNNINQIKENIDLVDGFIIGINNMSVNTAYNIDINELDKIITILNNKEVFISLNKNIENKDIELLKDILIKLNSYSIKGVLYSDVCFINLKKELNLNYDLIFAQEHLTTNYETINYWYDFGTKYSYLSSDITLEDILDIRRNTQVKLMVNIFGYLPMFVSKRHIVKNYLSKYNIDDKSDIYYMEKEDNIYPIIDNEIGTQVYSSKILNGIKEYFNLEKNDIDYVVFNGFEIDDYIFKQVISIINSLNKDNIMNCSKDIEKLLPNTFDGFMYQNTISKVKRND